MRGGVFLAAALCLVAPAAAQEESGTPYWASISSGKAKMRTGPGRTYPTIWVYQRRDLPVRVTKRYDNWRRIEGPGGAEGWMSVALLSERRTGMVTGETPIDVYDKADFESAVHYRLSPGVVGRLSQCDGQWCRISFTVGRKERGVGWVVQGALWGVDEDESFD
ncbi:SH3 domain-containing protein [Sphingomicrobium nitratireducens]|uniref:SH3 domain-containing protein n=1 Tax=Sphingomicrobium nitratireducens TaxID=2964666 RepID=UPI00223EA9F6|nr:SH3 domain-containing protein [Sphingomicrobium nitratireducens]